MSKRSANAVDLQKISALAERLYSFGDQSYEVNELSVDECKVLDGLVFECQSCNDWYYQRDNAKPNGAEWICKGCDE